MKVFAVTGTNGKTTVTYMLRNILETAGQKSALVGTVIHDIGGTLYEVNNTTPGKQTLREYMQKCEELKIENFVMEASSHALDQGRTDEAGIAYAAFTNLTRDHLDYHETMEKYYAAKKKLFLYPSVREAVINIDDRYGSRLQAELAEGNIRITTVSMRSKGSDIYATWRGRGLDGGELTLVKNGEPTEITLAAIGEFAAMNAALAAGLAWAAGIETAQIKAGLERFAGAPGRSEIIYGERTGIVAIIDYAHTPDALESILKAAAMIASDKKSKLITVFGCGGQRDKAKRKQMGVIAGEFSDICVITNDNPRNESSKDIFAMIEEGIYGTSCAYYIIEDREEALHKAVSLAERGDIIVVAGKGHEKKQILQDEEREFDDKEKIKEII